MIVSMDSNYQTGLSGRRATFIEPGSMNPQQSHLQHFPTGLTTATYLGGGNFMVSPVSPSTQPSHPVVSLSAASEHSVKRGRQYDFSDSNDDDDDSNNNDGGAPLQPSLAAIKRSKSNTYIAPKTVPKSFVSAMGSLAGGTTGKDTNLRVHFRRQLSGGQMECFLGDHDAMDVDAADSRPRRMSL